MEGVPIPNVQWHSEGFPVPPVSDPYQQIYLVPTNSPHTTTYTCIGISYDRVRITASANVTVIVEGKLISIIYI